MLPISNSEVSDGDSCVRVPVRRLPPALLEIHPLLCNLEPFGLTHRLMMSNLIEIVL